ncbi:organic solute transporter alpha-like protein [Homarus americanus]|uniref:organic solute transporter alpha-like protein n=1 Tax=Homarus americanus TaxID=6706 RepID=UPI001C44E3AE|nr:organic solute transporter alpha-like protein [Homarus americanus]
MSSDILSREINSTEVPTSSESECEDGYLPTVAEYREALDGYHTTMVVGGSILTVVLYALFLEQIVFIVRNVNKIFRRHIIWITSVYPFMTMMSVISIVIPRAETYTKAIKVTYMSAGISHFMDLTTLMFGSEKVMLHELQRSRFNLKVGPLCCCCFCFPSPKVTKSQLTVVRWLVWQQPYSQALYFMILLLWSTAESKEDGTIDPNSNYLWLCILDFLSFFCGIYALNVISILCRGHLDHYSYVKKLFSIKTLVWLTKLQGLIFNIFATYNVFPCISRVFSPSVYKLTVENTLYLVEMMILGPFAYIQYHNLDFLTRNPVHVEPSRQEKKQSISYLSGAQLHVSLSLSDDQLKETSGYGDLAMTVSQEPHSGYSPFHLDDCCV